MYISHTLRDTAHILTVIRNKSMTHQILEYFGNSHASYIHARGKSSTNKMVELLEAQKNEKILEIGFGQHCHVSECI